MHGFIVRILVALAISATLPLPGAASERTRDAAANACIAENSGAESVACLTAMAEAADAERLALEAAFLARAEMRLKANDIGETHHGIAIADMRSASQAFKDYAEHQCEAEVGLSGAAASGSGQIHGSCKIRLIDDRIAHLKRLLARDAMRPVATPTSTSTPSPLPMPSSP